MNGWSTHQEEVFTQSSSSILKMKVHLIHKYNQSSKRIQQSFKLLNSADEIITVWQILILISNTVVTGRMKLHQKIFSFLIFVHILTLEGANKMLHVIFYIHTYRWSYTRIQHVLHYEAGVLAYNKVKNISTSGMFWTIWMYLSLLDSSSRMRLIWASRGISLANGIPNFKLVSPHRTFMSSIITSTTVLSDISRIFSNSELHNKRISNQPTELPKE